jgi:exopolyphosphatase/guanosine-5'-triphosphate,3'-diphosphate pyrophosphatase
VIFSFNRRAIPQIGQVVGLIDIGTNSIRMLLVRIRPDLSYSILSHRKESVRLGEGEFPTMQLQPAAMHRAVMVCRRFVEMARAHDVDEIQAVATSATRDARNQADFLRLLRREANLVVRVVSGKEEARLIYLGVSSGIHMEDREALFLDIGGGSTEVIVGTQDEYSFLDTLQLGHIRLTLAFLEGDTDPISQDRFKELQEHVLDTAVRSLMAVKERDVDFAVGSSGTVQNLADIAARMFLGRRREPDDVLQLEHLTKVRKMLCNLPLSERSKVPGINADRTDVIIPGAAILETFMQELELSEIQVSDRGLRDGLLLDYLARQGQDHADAGISFRERSVLRLGRSLRFNEDHARRVAELSLQLFDSGVEAKLHKYGEWERELLYYAALLHDIGIALSYSGHHNHSHYFIKNADLLGFDQTEIDIMAATAYFHRKRTPRKKYSRFKRLGAFSRKRVSKLSTLLSMAESLDRSHLGLVERAKFSTPKKERAVLHLQASQHCPLELWGVAYQKKAFRNAFGRKLWVEMEGVEHPAPPVEVSAELP